MFLRPTPTLGKVLIMQKPISGLSSKNNSRVVSILSQYPAVEKAILYGSRAMGNYKAGSDIDLTLQGSNLSHHEIFQIATAFDESMLPYMVDLSILDHIENQDLLQHIKRVGVVAYERGG